MRVPPCGLAGQMVGSVGSYIIRQGGAAGGVAGRNGKPVIPKARPGIPRVCVKSPFGWP